ncbi:MAG: PorV/PorQ family protein [Bacteroidia bacterium]
MKKSLKYKLLVVAAIIANVGFAGNPDRSGGAGATQLLVNPYARSYGLGGANSAFIRGIESQYSNIGGLAYTNGTELIFSNLSFLTGAGINISNLGLAQSIGEEGSGGVVGLSITSWNFGQIPITTFEQPDQTIGTYSPQVINIGASYAKQFSNSITAGILMRLISEGVVDVRANGVALDAGVQYQTNITPGKKKIKNEDFRFGIGVRNIGPDMTFRGGGLSIRAINSSTGADRRVLFDAEKFNLPALVNIGVAYDMRLDKTEDTYFHKLTAMGNFTYNAFQSNIISIGGEYSYKEMFFGRFGYTMQGDNTFDFSQNNPQYRVPTYDVFGGVTFRVPVSKSGNAFAIDYSYAPTRIFNGNHVISLRLNFGGNN